MTASNRPWQQVRRAAQAATLSAALALSAAVPARAASPLANAAPAPTPGHYRDASLDDYRSHLTALTTLTEACAKARTIEACDPLLVGPDDRVPLGADHRLVRYGWLRVLFSKAEEPDQPAAKAAAAPASEAEPQGVRQPPPTTSQLLQDAETRLAADLARADASAEAAASHTQERAVMRQVLAGNEFRGLQQPTAQDSLLEKVSNWLNNLFNRAATLRARSAWVGRMLVGGFVLGVCIALVWALLQMERRWRVRLVPEDRGPAPGAASARNWQLWLEDARRAAAAGQWREAIHFVYWASISRLESRRLWPADRARTPRGYLALVAPEDPRKAGLTALTGNFERIWYGGRPAAELDYHHAEELATAVMAGGSSEGGGA